MAAHKPMKKISKAKAYAAGEKAETKAMKAREVKKGMSILKKKGK